MKRLMPLLLAALLLSSCATTEDTYDIVFPEGTSLDGTVFWIDSSADPLDLGGYIADELSYYGFRAYAVEDKDDIGKLSASSGTAFALSSDILVTNSHVVGNAEKVTVVIDGKDVEADVIRNEKDADVAVLRVPVSLPYSFIFADDVEKGEHVTALGYPLPDVMGSESKMTDGIVSSLTGMDDTVFRFQFSAGIQPGSSGGPIFDDDFMVVGMAVSTLSDIYTLGEEGFVSQDVNYAIKEDIVRYVAEDLISHDESYSVDSLDEALQAVFMVKADEDADISDDVIIDLDYTYDFMRGYSGLFSASGEKFFVDPIVFTLYSADGTRIGQITESSYAGRSSVSETARDTAEYVARHIFYSFAERFLPMTSSGERIVMAEPEAPADDDFGYGFHGSKDFE